MTFSTYFRIPPPAAKVILPPPSIEKIANIVSAETDIPVYMMQKKTRKREIVQSRQIAMYLMKLFTHKSLKTIGAYFGGRDHTTVIHACQTVKDLCDTDPYYRETVIRLERRFEDFG